MRTKFNDGGLFGALNRAGSWTGPGAGVEKKKTPRPGGLIETRRGIGAGVGRFPGPEGPVTNTITDWKDNERTSSLLLLMHTHYALIDEYRT